MSLNSSSNQTFNDLSYWLDLLGLSFSIEALTVYSLLPLCLISVVLNSISFWILNKKEFMLGTFFSYLRIYVLNSSVFSLILITAPLFSSKRILKFSNSYTTSFYGCYIFSILMATLYLFSSLLEILIVVERMTYFLPNRFKKIDKMGVKKFCFVLLVLSFLVNSPMFFVTYPKLVYLIKLDQDTTYPLFYWDLTHFSFTIEGSVILSLMGFVRDVLTLVVKIVFNGISAHLVRNYIKRLKKEKLEFALKISTSKLHIKRQKSIHINQEAPYISKTDRKHTLIAIIMSVFSFLEHFFYISSYIFFLFQNNSLISLFFYLNLISLAIKHSTNIFIFYKFNNLFRTHLKKSLLKM